MRNFTLAVIGFAAFLGALFDQVKNPSDDLRHPAINMHWWGISFLWVLGGVFVLLIWSIVKNRKK